jgi:hypothetical protein
MCRNAEHERVRAIKEKKKKGLLHKRFEDHAPARSQRMEMHSRQACRIVRAQQRAMRAVAAQVSSFEIQIGMVTKKSETAGGTSNSELTNQSIFFFNCQAF